MRCYTVDIFTDDNGFNVVTIGMLYLGISTVVLFVLSIYLSYVFPGEYGVRKSPFFPITGELLETLGSFASLSCLECHR